MNLHEIPAHPELSRLFCASDVLSDDRDVTITASPEECAALAKRFGYREISKLEARISLTPWRRKGVRASGDLNARIVQDCSVTLEPVMEQVNETLEALFWPKEHEADLEDDGRSGEVFSELGEEDIPELFEEDRIDLGELVAEWLALSANPYPRKDGAKLPDSEGEGSLKAAERPDSPFGVLAGFKVGQEGGE